MVEMGGLANPGRYHRDDNRRKDNVGFPDRGSLSCSLLHAFSFMQVCGWRADDQADKNVLTGELAEKAQRCGSTASIALLHSLDEPAQPYWASQKLNLIIGHCG